MQKCSTVQISFYCQGAEQGKWPERPVWGHWQNVHIRLQAGGQPLNFGNLGADVRQKNYICSKMFFNVFYCGFLLSRILILLNFPDYWEQKSNFTSHFKYKIHTCHECDKYPKPSVTCHLTHVSSTRKILQKKRLRDWSERDRRGTLVVLTTDRVSLPPRATEGYTGPQRGRTNQARAIAESNPRPRTYPPLNLGVHDLFNLPTN